MGKSLARVTAALAAAGVQVKVIATPAGTQTAALAAAVAGCRIDQIVKSILFRGQHSGSLRLFLTAGGQQVDLARAGALADEPLGKADAAIIRSVSGFAIGGVAPVGHLTPPLTWIDPLLMTFPLVWAAAGTPQHIFAIDPNTLQRITGAVVADFTASA